ncbi:hypothetical protein [Leptospira harrisiae]|uniref:Uncharacterized protein n=1 Tax=Leptospira harrisiae TaxID=2023189 RepID=A0A2N0AG26_9LEPT|nr:hypothetical protein [Leptospira harrisiae]PJZ83247.1 hypothetical protein CH364_16320 [Leptospira harrisiae]PKA06704.1 hypothetical protein CH366_17955 [Leptospira harrisiae]
MSFIQNNHNHGWKSVAKGTLGDGFSFHSKLASWLQDYTNIPKETELEILEVSCGEASCPTEETMIVWKEEAKQSNENQNSNHEARSIFKNHEFRISRRKEQISKMDVDLSWKRFVSKG